MRVWTVEHHEVPLVSFLALLPVGASVDPPNLPGLAAITGDLLDEGCGPRTALEVHEALGRIGAQFDTEVGVDAMVLGMTALGRFADRALDLLADMIVRPRLEQPDFDRVRELRLNRLVQLRDLPPSVADRVFVRILYEDHPYGHLPIGTEGSLRSMTLGDVVTLHRDAFHPARMTLIAVGDAGHDELADLVERAFAGWVRDDPPRSLPDALSIPSPVPVNGRLAIVNRAGAAQSELRIGHVGVPRSSPDYHALLVLNMVLGGQFVSRLNMNLREQKGYTYGARTSFEFRVGPGPFLMQASVHSEATAEAVRETLSELRAIGADRPVTRDELELGRAALTRGYPRGFETGEQIARAAAQLALYGLPDDYFSTFVPRVMAIDEREVTRAAETHIDPQRLLVVIVGDRLKVAPALERLDLGEPTEVAIAS
jgi:predicted Zn-dependent peptidase